MDSLMNREKMVSFLNKYKYAALVVCIGLVFMLLPAGQKDEIKTDQFEVIQENPDMDVRLEQILSLIHGVGKVKVLLTVSEGEQTRYVYDEDCSDAAGNTSRRKETIIISTSGRDEQGLVQQVIAPVYLGAVIVCQGGDQQSPRQGRQAQ